MFILAEGGGANKGVGSPAGKGKKSGTVGSPAGSSIGSKVRTAYNAVKGRVARTFSGTSRGNKL